MNTREITSHPIAAKRRSVSVGLVERLLGAYHLTFGVAGVAAIGELSSHFLAQIPDAERSRASLLLFVMGLVFIVVSLVGVGLIKSHPHAWAAAVALQVAQVPMWNLVGSSYTFVAGAYAGLMHSGDGLSPFVGVMASVHVGWNRQVDLPAVGLNLIPLAIAAIAWRIGYEQRKRLRASRDQGGATVVDTSQHTP